MSGLQTLHKILPEVRLLAEHRGDQWLKLFDLMVEPWARHALGKPLTKLRYDAHLSQMQTVSWPEVHGTVGDESRCRPVRHAGTVNTGNLELKQIQQELKEIKDLINENKSSTEQKLNWNLPHNPQL